MNKKVIIVQLLGVVLAQIIGKSYRASVISSEPFPSNYESQSAQSKQDFIWNKALASDGTTGSLPIGIELLHLIAPIWLGGQDFAPVGHNESDQNASGRKKLIHSISKSAKVKFNFESNPFTGVFAEKECIGIMRASSANPATIEKCTPGMGVKIFRDKVPSGNFVAMWDLFGQNYDTNFFSHPFSNHVSDVPEIKSYVTNKTEKESMLEDQYSDQDSVYNSVHINTDAVTVTIDESTKFKVDTGFFKFMKELPLHILGYKFSGFEKNVNMVGLSDLAKYRNNGEKVYNPSAPFALVFKPNPALTSMCHRAPLEGSNFGCLKDIIKGTLLYTIYYVDEPIDKKDVQASDLKLLGTMKSDSEFISSRFMDEEVQFKHVFWTDEIEVLGKQSWNTKITKEFAREDGASKWEALLASM